MIAGPSRDAADVGAGVTYPIQPGKVQPPALRDETLARTRLLEWLDVKIHRRVVFVIADAGYGKTTLLADFSRRTRLRTIWYRLDEEDRDWVGFLAHMVAAGREHDPAFAPRTASILRSLEPGGPTREDAIETFIEELPTIARDGAALILDDFHLADEVGDIRTIAREIVARGPERLSIVFASRRPPSIPVAKLRSLGELAEIGIADLRFSDTELEQLFRETYGRPLEPDVLVELARRTEGWAASLTLVQAALRERTPAETRSFVRGLSGARDELHDYLAEEVVGDLPTIQQQFLMRTSLLQRVTPELAQVATGLDAVEVQSMITEAERLGLLGRRAKRRSSEQRYHPLVREFLEDRLRKDIGAAGVDELHVTVAKWAEPSDWRTAAYHFAEAREFPRVRSVLEAHLDTILGTGAFAAAAELMAGLDEGVSFATEIIKSRIARQEGDMAVVMRHARRAHELAPNSELAMNNLAGAAYFSGEVELAMRLATKLADADSESPLKDIAVAFSLMMEASRGADVGRVAAHLEELAERHRASGHAHYEGVSLLNASLMHGVRGDAELALQDAARAAEALNESSSGSELASAVFARGWALAWLGRIDEARSAMREIGENLKDANRAEYVYEVGNLESLLGELSEAEDALAVFPVAKAPTSYREMIKATRMVVELRRGEYAAARETLASIEPDVLTTEAGRQSKVLALRALLAALTADRDAVSQARAAIAFAAQQGASIYQAVGTLALAAVERRLNSAILGLPQRLLPSMSMCAEVIVSGLASITDDALAVVREEAGRRPYRWRDALRTSIASSSNAASARMAAGRLLDEIGEPSDVVTLRRLSRQSRAANDRALGRGLARRLAATASVSDLGRVRVTVGAVEVQTGTVRRKVLALLCYLLTRPQMSATREEVMDALWPEIDPAAASNSLNQTIYFLRRVFEPEYDDETSPGYVRQESDLVFLDHELVVSTSRRCAALIAQLDREPSIDLVEQLSSTYTDRFASDFAYEEWASDYREWLHVSYLQIIEEAITTAIRDGRFLKTVPLARRALETDPRLESLGLSLLKLLKGSGAHAAAAEQYERYASLLRTEIGVEAPAFDSIEP